MPEGKAVDKGVILAKEKFKKTEVQPLTQGEHVVAERGAMPAFWLFAFSGMAALIYEVAWTRALSLVLGSTTYALSTMLASFMAGLSLGAFLGGIMADRFRRPVLLFAYLEAGIAVSALLVIPLINLLPPLYARIFYAFHQSFSSFSIIQFVICFAIMLVPTTLMGATFPVVCKINFVDKEKIGKDTGGVYAINTVGAIAGALLAGFVLIPGIGVRLTNLAAACVNIAISAVLAYSCLTREEIRKWGVKIGAGFITALIFSTAVWAYSGYPVSFYTAWKYKSYDHYKETLQQQELPKWEKVFEADNIQGNVKVFNLPDGKALFVNGRAESHSKGDLMNTSLLAYLPASINPDAKSFLSIGLGTGNTVHFASTLPHLKEIYSVEINPAVEEAVRRFLYPHLFEDKRIRFITADARNYLMLVGEKYDIISSEPSYPVDQGFSHLFSKEFFELVKSRLNENGVFYQWVPTYLFNEEQMAMLLKTFSSVFPNTTVWGVEDKEAGFIGVAGDKPQPVAEMKRRVDFWLGQQGIKADYSLYVNTDIIEAATSGYTGPLNTDDHPVLEFYAARNMLAGSEREGR